MISPQELKYPRVQDYVILMNNILLRLDQASYQMLVRDFLPKVGLTVTLWLLSIMELELRRKDMKMMKKIIGKLSKMRNIDTDLTYRIMRS